MNTTPNTAGIAAGTMLELIERNARAHTDLPATIDGDTRLTWSGYRRRARAVALALLQLGVAPGQVVGLHMVNRAEHVLGDVGALYAGATPTSYYNTLAADQLAYVAHDSAAVVAIVDAHQLPLWRSIRPRLPRLRHLVASRARRHRPGRRRAEPRRDRRRRRRAGHTWR